MLSRLLLASVICLLVHRPVHAEPTVFFRGKHLTYRHYVYGQVTSSSRRAGTINLGYAHGLQPGQDVGVVRRSSGQLIPLGVLRLVEVRPEDSYGELQGDFRLQADDLVIMSARNLDLWQGRTRSNQLVIQSILSRNGRSYDSGAVSSAILNEVGRDDDLIQHRIPSLHVNRYVYDMQRPVQRSVVLRGAFRPASSEEDGVANLLSEEDREKSLDKSTLDLETALSRFVSANAAGKVDAPSTALRLLAEERTDLMGLDEVRLDLEAANAQIRSLLRPK
jgi:hypothetical protein